MPKRKGPVLVRHEDETASRSRRGIRAVRLVLTLIGLALLGYYGYTLGEQYLYQSYQNWAFDQDVAGHGPVTFADFARQKVFGTEPSAPVPRTQNGDLQSHQPLPAHGSVLGRVEVPRLKLSAMVREGVDAATLSNAVGHVPTTALAGDPGNFAIAAHRDTLFRALKDIKEGDEVRFEAADHKFTYRIFSLRIVKPTEISVLRPDGGFDAGRIKTVSTRDGTDPQKLITLITCYPFYYVGSAPKRFIVQGELVPQQTSPTTSVKANPPPRTHNTGSRSLTKTREPRSPRGSSHVERVRSDSHAAPRTKKRNFFKRVLNVF